jgi:2-octaprenylphenol hydroxylase
VLSDTSNNNTAKNAAKNTANKNATNNTYDVIVVGAGIVGQTMALGLAKQGLKVALIDQGPAPEVAPTHSALDDAHYSSRVSAISAASQVLLADLGAWSHIARKQRYTKMQVWDKDGFGDVSFDANDTKGSAVLATASNASLAGDKAEPEQTEQACLGHIIENDQLNIALHHALNEHDNASSFYQTQIVNMQTNERCAQLVLANNQVIEAKLLIGADGANSQVRQAFGFKQTFWDYDHQAIVANVTTQLPHNGCAKQAFTQYGPLAFLPLPNPHKSSIVFSQQTARAQTLMAMDDSEFEKALLVAIDNHYGKVALSTTRQSFPLRMRYARQWTGTRVALIGDAAHTIHPLAGQGANLGLSDVATLLRLIELTPEHIGRRKELRQYERKQKAEALKVIATMEGFKRLFDDTQPLKKLVRNVGLSSVNKLPLIKQFFMKQAIS